jgi:hypothetical protein
MTIDIINQIAIHAGITIPDMASPEDKLKWAIEQLAATCRQNGSRDDAARAFRALKSIANQFVYESTWGRDPWNDPTPHVVRTLAAAVTSLQEPIHWYWAMGDSRIGGWMETFDSAATCAAAHETYRANDAWCSRQGLGRGRGLD